jgi:hypothetical protein
MPSHFRWAWCVGGVVSETIFFWARKGSQWCPIELRCVGLQTSRRVMYNRQMKACQIRNLLFTKWCLQPLKVKVQPCTKLPSVHTWKVTWHLYSRILSFKGGPPWRPREYRGVVAYGSNHPNPRLNQRSLMLSGKPLGGWGDVGQIRMASGPCTEKNPMINGEWSAEIWHKFIKARSLCSGKSGTSAPARCSPNHSLG